MSTSLFAAKQYKSSRNLKKLAISSPINTKSPTGSLQPSPLFSPLTRDPVIVLRARYDFTAESPVEISVKRNDYVKLVHRPGNGWLLVKFIDKTDSGLVPASYVDIVANDIQNPITLEWLLETKPPSQRKKEHIKNIRINTVLQNRKMRYLYRLDITMSSGKQIFLCKYYQDFYNLHVALVTSLGRLVPLPVFPKPRGLMDKTHQKTSPNQADIKNLLEVAGQLSKYLRQLLIIEKVRACDEFIEFIDDEQFKRIVIRPGDAPIADAKINDMLHKDLVNIVDSLLRADMSLKSVSVAQTPSPAQKSPPKQKRQLSMSPKERQMSTSPSIAALMPSFVSPSSIPTVPNTPEAENTATTESPMAESKSSQTLSTFSLLLAGYGEDEAGLNLQETKTTDSSDSQMNLNETTLQDPIDLPDIRYKNMAQAKDVAAPASDVSHDSVSTIGSQGLNSTHYLSGEDSLMLNSARHKSLSCEPKTPILSLDQTFARHPPKLFGSEEDEQIRPLLPKKHKEAYMSASSSTATITQDTKVKQKHSEYVRIKVTLCNEDDDKVILRVRRSDLHSLQSLKHMVLKKIYEDPALIHHYTLRPFEEALDRSGLDEHGVMDYVRSRPKAHLKLQRVR
ncbi:hypothetical protein C7M61_003004 [Candidozyma pseudohaemuli]|uniref:SH3 domain-containing protein n=1 Tax=Candidozyma pseudohaemuli TaxID=418784 RepID=A0A2P7YP88_9ASCO|nr:hypothetical protein C7M61_003004 [[Candida] pseudohaemulonii]PSK37760.1 hypothetical protein C7M61_003004 [[Candida] pseudohaemulonii]